MLGVTGSESLLGVTDESSVGVTGGFSVGVIGFLSSVLVGVGVRTVGVCVDVAVIVSVATTVGVFVGIVMLGIGVNNLVGVGEGEILLGGITGTKSLKLVDALYTQPSSVPSTRRTASQLVSLVCPSTINSVP